MTVFVAEDGQTLGTRLRASRLRYGWARELRRYLRLTDVPGTDDAWTVELLTPEAMANMVQSKGAKAATGHRVWWEMGGEPLLIACVRRYMTDEPSQVFVIDGDGNRL